MTTHQKIGEKAMAPAIVQINYTFDMNPEAFSSVVSPAADAIAAVPGLRWKIWLISEEERVAGGLYLFEDAAAAQAYLDGPIVAQLAANPAIRDVSVRQFGVMSEPTAITRGPVHELI